MELTDKIKSKFVRLDSRLSPENLYCDGEASDAEVRIELREINREWKALERSIGRKVEQESREVWKWTEELYEKGIY